MTNPIIRFMEWIDETLFATAGKISPWLMPIPSGLILGWTFGVNMVDQWGKAVAEFAGWSATAGVIGLGAYASHNAVKRGGSWWWLVAGHAGLVIGSLLVLKAEDHIKGVGIILELMTVLSYIASAGARKTAAEQEANQRQAETEASKEKDRQQQDYSLQLEKMRLAHQAKLAKIEADKEAKIANAGVKPSVNDSVNQTVKDDADLALKQAILQQILDSQLNISQLANVYNVSRPTIYKRLDEMAGEGSIYRNGEGWKIKKD